MKTLNNGDTLRNGATVLEHDPGAGIVLAMRAVSLDRVQYITWHLDSLGAAYWGHYFDDMVLAVQDYQRRCGIS